VAPVGGRRWPAASIDVTFAERLDGSLRWSLAMLDACERR